MTPLELILLIEIHTTPQSEWSLPESDARDRALSGFIEHGIANQTKKHSTRYDLTELGRAWLEAILSTPVPVCGFFDERTGEKIEWD